MKKNESSFVYIYYFLSFPFSLVLSQTTSFQRITELPLWNQLSVKDKDWLVQPFLTKAGVFKSADNKDIILYIGLVRRVFRVTPNLACIDYTNESNNQQLLRAIKPEALITLNGRGYNIGGLHGQTEKAYLLNEWLNKLTIQDSDFHFTGFMVKEISGFLNGKSRGWTSLATSPSGKLIDFSFRSDLKESKILLVIIRYEMYDGIPLLIKSLIVENKGTSKFLIIQSPTKNIE